MALQVGGERLIELRPAADALCNEQWNYRCRIPPPNLSLLPFLNGPRGLANVIHGVAEFAQHIKIGRASCREREEMSAEAGAIRREIRRRTDGYRDHKST